MTIKVVSFAMLKEIIGSKYIEIEENINTIRDLVDYLVNKFPKLSNYLISGDDIDQSILFILNKEEVLSDNYNSNLINDLDEITILPPSGGG